tara:strand:- start:869 stop:1477 length:609 start_codon:yes stop_codon:yes gene_type:complete
MGNKITDLKFDDKNFNKGTQYGKKLMEQSLSKFGAGRSILIDKNNRIIAGNKTTENFGELGLEDVKIVETDGKTLIAVKRNDIDLSTPQGREFALADNQSAKTNIDFDFELLGSEFENNELEEWGLGIWSPSESVSNETDYSINSLDEKLGRFMDAKIKNITIPFETEEFEDVVNRLEQLLKKYDCEDYRTLIYKILENEEI